MPVRPDLQQLEKCIDDALRKNDFKPLMTLLQIDICEDVKIKCSKQFLRKLDNLICREIILSQQQSKDEAVMNMIEDLLDLLMVVYDINDEGKNQVLESFIPHICALVIDSRVNFCIQQEALKKMNLMLDRIPQDANKILSNQEILTLMSNMGERILDVGDYELQVGIVEALCRMTTEKRRQELAYEWFSMDFIANAFKEIKDCEFETDCRIFLNLVNGMLGDRRRVFTFPCLSAFLGKYELQIPSDEKLEEFWIDFNLGSHTLSFYIAGDDDDHQWEAVTVPEEKVQMYNIEAELQTYREHYCSHNLILKSASFIFCPAVYNEDYLVNPMRESKKLLTLTLKNIVKISKKEGKELLLYFDASLEITNVTNKLFGENKYKEFTRKQGISVAKTSIHILFDASGSQILVPESQPSPDKENVIHLKEKSNLQKKLINPLKPDDSNSQDEITTPSRKKMSEASMIVPDTDRYTVRSPILLINTSTPRRSRAINSAEKAVSKTSESGMDYAVSLRSRQSDGRNTWNNKANHNKTAVVQNKEHEDNESPDQNFNEIEDTLSDTYAVGKVDKPALPGVLDISKNKAHSRWACWTPVTTIKLSNNQRAHALPEDTFTQDTGVNKKCTKQKSVSDDDSEETQRVKHSKDVIKCNKSDEAEVCERNIQEQNHPKYSQKKDTTNTKKSDWHIESETTYKSVLLNKTTEESLIYKKTCVLSKDVNTTICDKSPSIKSMRSHTKSRKELMSELTSCELEEIPVRENPKGKRFTGAAENLISQINKRYYPNDGMISTRKPKEPLDNSGFSKKHDLQFNKVKRKSYRKLKTTVVNVTSECPQNDVYNFSLNGADEPVIKLGIQEFQATTREASMDNSLKLVDVSNHDEHDPSLKTKDKRMLSHKKKILFSDTETERGWDDSKTDISWLKEPKSKRLVDYSRNKNTKRCKSRKPRSSMENEQPRSTMELVKNIMEKDYEAVVDERTRLPRRATKTKKNYKDLSTSESESEKEYSYLFKDKLPTKEETIHSRAQTKKVLKKQQRVFNTEALKGLPSEEQKNSSKLRDGRKDSLYLSCASVSGSSSSVEMMRCTEKITERDFTQDYDYITKSLSPYPKAASPEFLNGNNRVVGCGKSPSAVCVRKSCSPASELPFSPIHTPTKNNSVMNMKSTNSVINNQRTQHCNSHSDVSSNISEKLYMEPESPDICKNHMQSKREENHAASPLSLSSENTEKIWFDMPSDNTHVSGPSKRGSKRQMYLEEDELSNFNEVEDEAEEGEHLLSKKLCQGENFNQHTYKTSLSTPEVFVPKDWQQELQGAGMFYDNISSDYKRKTDTQHKIMDDFTTKTLKLTQQHLMAMTYQARERRDENIDKLQVTLLDELEKVEKASQTFRDLEKELVDMEEKLVQKMRAYHRSERERFRVLKTSLDNSFLVYNSVYEKTVYTSEMCLMKANMKKLQDKLLKEMHEEELLNIRRGLESLFKAHEGNES